MNVHFIVNPIAIDGGWSPWSERVGGSEECVIEWSARLANKYNVKVFHNGIHGTYKKVEYLSHADFTLGDVTVNVNYPEFKINGRSVYYTSLTENPDLKEFDAVCVLSEYAKNNTGVIHSNIHIVPPGYDASLRPKEKIKKRCLYASSPDRGLQTLELIWPSIVENHPDAELVVTYGGELALDNVINMGTLTKEEMNDLYATSDIWLHPANGGELFCITGVKAQVAQAIPVYFPIMALAETVKAGVPCDNPRDMFVKLNSLLDDEQAKQDIRDELAQQTYINWEQSTEMLDNVIMSLCK